MYYDILLGALPVFLLFTEPRRYLEPAFLVILPLSGPLLGSRLDRYYHIRPVAKYPGSVPLLPAGFANLWVLNSMVLYLVLLLLILEYVAKPYGWIPSWFPQPYDTTCLFILWLWCGWKWAMRKYEGGSSKTAECEVELTAEASNGKVVFSS